MKKIMLIAAHPDDELLVAVAHYYITNKKVMK